jgi:hypothetical protein
MSLRFVIYQNVARTAVDRGSARSYPSHEWVLGQRIFVGAGILLVLQASARRSMAWRDACLAN